MNTPSIPTVPSYFPAIVCAVHDSPVDALVALCVPRNEAMDLVTASWRADDVGCIVATLDGGRTVAVLSTPEGRWAACNAFLEECCATHQEAGKRLEKLLRKGRYGYVGCVRHTLASYSETQHRRELAKAARSAIALNLGLPLVNNSPEIPHDPQDERLSGNVPTDSLNPVPAN